MTERVVTFSTSNSNKKLILQKSERNANRKWKFYNIQLSIAIQTDCIVILSRIVQSKKRTRIWKVTRQKFQRKISKANYLFLYNDEFTYVISIIRFHWRFQRQTSIVSNFRLFTTITTNQKHQNNWKNLRILSKHLRKMNFLYFNIEKQRFRSFCSFCESSKIKIRTVSSIIDRTTISTKT